jgi:putative restriction endonuclease
LANPSCSSFTGRSYIVGGGFFAKYMRLPLRLAWDAFQEGNGARSLDELRTAISRRRQAPGLISDNDEVGCVVIVEPFFFARELWITAPPDFVRSVVQGKGYSTNEENGRALWAEVSERLALVSASKSNIGTATVAAVESRRYGEPVPVRPRLGQGAFRVLVTDRMNVVVQ